MKPFINHYKVLGVSPNSSFDEIRKAFYSLAKKYHPDMKNHSFNDSIKRFQAIQEAYNTLIKDRTTYDIQYKLHSQQNYRKFYGNTPDDSSEYTYWEGKPNPSYSTRYTSPWSFSNVWSDMGLNEKLRNRPNNRAFIDSDEEVEDFYGYQYTFSYKKKTKKKKTSHATGTTSPNYQKYASGRPVYKEGSNYVKEPYLAKKNNFTNSDDPIGSSDKININDDGFANKTENTGDKDPGIKHSTFNHKKNSSNPTSNAKHKFTKFR